MANGLDISGAGQPRGNGSPAWIKTVLMTAGFLLTVAGLLWSSSASVTVVRARTQANEVVIKDHEARIRPMEKSLTEQRIILKNLDHRSEQTAQRTEQILLELRKTP